MKRDVKLCWRCERLFVIGDGSGSPLCSVRNNGSVELYCQDRWDEVADRDILIAIYERISGMPDLSELQTALTGLTKALTDMQPVIQANVDLSQTVIGKLEELAARIALLEPTQGAIDELKQAALAALATVQTDKDTVVSVNQAYTAELAKLAPAAPTPGPEAA